MIELWNTVVGFPDYEVSNTGRLRSWKNNRHGRRKTPVDITPVCKPGEKYPQKLLCNEEGRKKVRLHRLVATHWLPNPWGHPQVLHRDDDPNNNGIDNLYWGDFSDNAKDKVKNGRHNGGFYDAETKQAKRWNK